ncbi:conserved hypothetical protein [gamma proteobacterium NOR5-3]|nr:conserved hypothetical protein [gamma proteobacterium NOR5-3]
MNIADATILRDVLLEPTLAPSLSVAQWELVVRQARVSLLTIRLAVHLSEAGMLGHVPGPARKHLDAATTLRDRQSVAAVSEIHLIQEALETIDTRLILLKGAAYVAAQLPPARCRVFADFDILVPKNRLEAVELAMLSHGWMSTHNNEYDQRYYREWMHELPPMRHLSRASFLDIHHNILPEVSKIQPSANKLLEGAVPAQSFSGAFTLHPLDMILHSIVHVFQEGEFDKAMRDLFDLSELILEAVVTEDDWSALLIRAIELDIARSLFYAVDQLRRQLGQQVPDRAWARLQSYGPIAPVKGWMRYVFDRAILPNHSSSNVRGTAIARLFLFIRGHAIKMPPHRLIAHLGRKWLQRAHLLPTAS